MKQMMINKNLYDKDECSFRMHKLLHRILRKHSAFFYLLVANYYIINKKQ